MDELDDNYAALALSIIMSYPPDLAIRVIDNPTMERSYNNTITKEDVTSMAQLKAQGMTYREIGQVYGLTEVAVRGRLKRYQKVVCYG